MSVEPTQLVREVPEHAAEPLPYDQIADTLKNALDPDEVQEAREHWHREVAASGGCR